MGAVGEWLRVLMLQPNNIDARNNLGVSYAHLAKDENAELEFRKALGVGQRLPWRPLWFSSVKTPAG